MFPPSERDVYLDEIAQWIILYLLTANKPTAAEAAIFKRLPIRQNDFVVHRRLNSAWNVINLHQSGKQCLCLVPDSDKLQGHWLLMMFDCQPRITSESDALAVRQNWLFFCLRWCARSRVPADWEASVVMRPAGCRHQHALHLSQPILTFKHEKRAAAAWKWRETSRSPMLLPPALKLPHQHLFVKPG